MKSLLKVRVMSSKMLLESEIRNQFPMLHKEEDHEPFIYLDTSATSLKPRCVIEEMSHFALHEYGTVHRAVYQNATHATERYQQVRAKVKEFIHASSDGEIVFVRGATQGINLLASSLGELLLKEGDEVVISALEHHANIVPWQQICERKKALLKIVPVLADGTIDLKTYEEMLSPKVKIVSIAHVSNVLGTINPIKWMAKKAHEIGAVFCVDGAQAAGRLKIDVVDLDVDFYVFSAHKMYGPTGLGVLYGKYYLLDQMPPYETGGDMIKEVSFSHTSYQEAPLKFEAGTPSIIEVIGLGAAIDFIETIGLESIYDHEQYLLAILLEGLRAKSFVKVIGSAPERAGLVSFTIQGIHCLDVASFLDAKGICIRSGHLCAQPLLRSLGLHQVLRASIGIYTAEDEIHKFLNSLDSIYSLLN